MKTLTAKTIRDERLKLFARLREQGKTLAFAARTLQVSEPTAKRWEKLRKKALDIKANGD